MAWSGKNEKQWSVTGDAMRRNNVFLAIRRRVEGDNDEKFVVQDADNTKERERERNRLFTNRSFVISCPLLAGDRVSSFEGTTRDFWKIVKR